MTFSSIITALSFALDLVEGAQPGHALRTCVIGMRLGREIGLSEEQLSDLYYALLLKDVGCSSNATRLHQIVGGDEIRAKAFTKSNDLTRLDWKQVRFLLTQVHTGEGPIKRLRAMGSMVSRSSENAELLIRLRCHQGSAVVSDLGLGRGIAEAIYNLDEHWNGLGYPERISGDAIPLLARVISLAQAVEVFHHQFGADAALDCVHRRSGRWFDPQLARVATMMIRSGRLFLGLNDAMLKLEVAAVEPRERAFLADPATVDKICVAFAGVVDAKSHSTYMHSIGVAGIARDVGAQLGLDDDELLTLRRAALLHDIGKLSVPNSILDKPGKLDKQEWERVKLHTHYTYEILSRIPSFDEIADVASCHHEKLDGSGYCRGLNGAEISRTSRILTVADMFDALSSNRPYRGALTREQVLDILRKDVPHAIDPDVFAALESVCAAA